MGRAHRSWSPQRPAFLSECWWPPFAIPLGRWGRLNRSPAGGCRGSAPQFTGCESPSHLSTSKGCRSTARRDVLQLLSRPALRAHRGWHRSHRRGATVAVEGLWERREARCLVASGARLAGRSRLAPLPQGEAWAEVGWARVSGVCQWASQLLKCSYARSKAAVREL